VARELHMLDQHRQEALLQFESIKSLLPSS
jgi:hypothetical protein